MCTLLVFYRVFRDNPLVLLSNRDEMLDRTWSAPQWLSLDPPVFGPRDGAAGGTWVGVNGDGLVAALTNHYGTLTRHASMCSRGTVVLEALRRGDAAHAREAVRNLSPACKSFTLLLADPRDAFVVDHTPSETTIHTLSPGRHVVTNDRFGLEDDCKAQRCRSRMAAFHDGSKTPGLRELAQTLVDHDKAAGQHTPLCIHPHGEDRFGTSSSTIVAIDDQGVVRRFAFAPGPPCTTPFADVTPDFAQRAMRVDTASEPVV
jgi:hypothetical protein